MSGVSLLRWFLVIHFGSFEFFSEKKPNQDKKASSSSTHQLIWTSLVFVCFYTFLVFNHIFQFLLPWPDEVTTEDETQDEDKDACPKDNHVDVERQVLEGDGRHGARLVGVNQSQTTEAP